MEITVKFRCMFTGRNDVVVLVGNMAHKFFWTAYKTSMIDKLETVDSDSVYITDWKITKACDLNHKTKGCPS
jgi:hypothetical protein